MVESQKQRLCYLCARHFKKALHLCLKRIKDAKNENELRRLTKSFKGSCSTDSTRMPKIKKPPPYFMKHLVDRFREGRISVGDFDALQDWLNSIPTCHLESGTSNFQFLWRVKAQCPRHF